MATTDLQVQQNDIIRRVLEIKDADTLAKIKSLIMQDTHTNADAEAMSKSEILAGIEEAFHVAKQARERKIKGQPVEEFLHEL